jgi:hypothetical protein
MLKNASTDAETSALSIPVLSAIWLIKSAFVTMIGFDVLLFWDRKFRSS